MATRAVESFAFKCGAAFADDDLREVRERREIAGRSDRTLRGNYWMDFGVEHFAESVDDLGADAAESFGESVGAEKHHGAGFGFAEGIANAAGVRADEIYLELRDLFSGDADGSEFAEAGVDAVGGGAGGDEFFDDGAGGVHAFDGGWVERDGVVVKRDGVQLFEGEIVAGRVTHGVR